MSKKILGIGNAIVDVFVKVDDIFLSKNNLIKGSMKLIEKTEFESLKNKIKIEKIEAGGSVANTMAGIAYLKGTPSFIGKINSDEFGKIYKKSLEKIKVDFSYSEKNENLPTGASIIFITPDSVFSISFIEPLIRLFFDKKISSTFTNTSTIALPMPRIFLDIFIFI